MKNPPLSRPRLPIASFWDDQLGLLIWDLEKVSFRDFSFLFIWANSLPTKDTFKSPGLEFGIFLHIEGFSLFVPPPLFWDLKFQGYYAITLHHHGIALFSTPNCPPSVLVKAPEFLANLLAWLRTIFGRLY
jgi:hypothetical protein